MWAMLSLCLFFFFVSVLSRVGTNLFGFFRTYSFQCCSAMCLFSFLVDPSFGLLSRCSLPPAGTRPAAGSTGQMRDAIYTACYCAAEISSILVRFLSLFATL